MCTYFISTYYSITEKKLYKHWSKQLHKLKALYFFPGYYWHVWSRFNCIYWEGNKRRLLSFKIDSHFIHSHILVGVHDSLQPSNFSCYTGIITGTTFICHSPNSAYNYNQIDGDMLKWYGFVCICATVIIFYDSVLISSLPQVAIQGQRFQADLGDFMHLREPCNASQNTKLSLFTQHRDRQYIWSIILLKLYCSY